MRREGGGITTGDVGRGYKRSPRGRPSPLHFGHQSRGRFGLVLLGVWTIGFFGLSHGRFSVIQLLAAAAALLVWFVTGARRKKVQSDRERWILTGHPSTLRSTTVRRIDSTR